MDIFEKSKNLFSKLEDVEMGIEGKEMLIKNCEGNIAALNIEKENITEDILINEKSMLVFRNIITDRTHTTKQEIENTLNHALASVPLQTSYSAEIVEDPESANKQMVIQLYDKIADKHRVPHRGTGTQVAQLTSLLARTVVIAMSNSRRMIVLDENMSGFNDKEAINMFGQILVSLAKNEKFQIFMVEHKSELSNVAGLHKYCLERNSYDEGLVLSDIVTLTPEQVEFIHN